MPTIKRKWYPGASYHVTARGNHRNDIASSGKPSQVPQGCKFCKKREVILWT